MCDQELIFICSIPVLIEKETTVDCNITVIELNSAGLDPSMYGLDEFVNPEDNPFLNKNNFYQNTNVDVMTSEVDYTLQYQISKL